MLSIVKSIDGNSLIIGYISEKNKPVGSRIHLSDKPVDELVLAEHLNPVRLLPFAKTRHLTA